MARGDRLAAMRIVPLVTKETQIETAEALCRGKKLLDLLPYQERKIQHKKSTVLRLCNPTLDQQTLEFKMVTLLFIIKLIIA